MAITAKQVNELRQQTGAGLMDCKKALTEADGNMDAAIDILRKKGAKVAELRAGRDANEGAVLAKTNDDATVGVVLHLSSETDFVAKNQDFIDFANQLTDVALASGVDSVDALMDQSIDGTPVRDLVNEKVAAIGENIAVANLGRIESDLVVPYIHAGNKIGVLVGLNKAVDGAADAGRDVAMQAAAMRPVALDESGVSDEVKERELSIAREKAEADGKPADIIDRIAEGSLKKFYKENVLKHQQFVKNPKQTVADYLRSVDGDLEIVDYRRFELGQ